MLDINKFGKRISYEGRQLKEWVSSQLEFKRAERAAEREAKADNESVEAEIEKTTMEATERDRTIGMMIEVKKAKIESKIKKDNQGRC